MQTAYVSCLTNMKSDLYSLLHWVRWHERKVFELLHLPAGILIKLICYE